MSYNVTKTVMRAEIPELKGKSIKEAYEFFKPILGEADDVDEWEGDTDYFHYDSKTHKYVPVQEYSYSKSENDRWGIDYILAYDNDYGERKGKANFSMDDLQVKAEELAVKFNIKPMSCRLVSYTWYNGGDEPIEFE